MTRRRRQAQAAPSDAESPPPPETRTPIRVILASASPRRATILRMLGIEPEIRAPAAVERPHAPDEAPHEYVRDQAVAKLRAARVSASRTLALAADTVVVLDGRILGKPADDSDARRMLALLSGKTHDVVTGLALSYGSQERAGFDLTRVTLRDLAEGEIRSYVASGEPRDKAGAYGIQDRGASLVRSVDGCFFNVMGLPVFRFLELLREMRLRYDPGTVRIEMDEGDDRAD